MSPTTPERQTQSTATYQYVDGSVAVRNTRHVNGDLQRQVGRRIRQIREERGVSQEKLAEQLGNHRTYIGAIERGERNMSLQVVETLAAQLGVQPYDLLCPRADDAEGT